ncbi:hypothetical protein J6590_085992 [Homalodisca vitripennis]|nr:hypothetical protein J6590_085992 [Homalodisca vitripennis]
MLLQSPTQLLSINYAFTSRAALENCLVESESTQICQELTTTETDQPCKATHVIPLALTIKKDIKSSSGEREHSDLPRLTTQRLINHANPCNPLALTMKKDIMQSESTQICQELTTTETDQPCKAIHVIPLALTMKKDISKCFHNL